MGKFSLGKEKWHFAPRSSRQRERRDTSKRNNIEWRRGKLAGKRGRGKRHLHAKSVGEVIADTEEHAPDFRPYLSTIDRADKILWLRETVGEKAEDRMKDEWR